MVTFTAQRGETRRWLLSTPLGTNIAGWSATGSLRAWNQRQRRVETGAELKASLTVASFAGDDTRGPGFWLTLAAADCAALATGFYQADARIVLPGGDVEITDPWLIEVKEPATEAPA